MITTRRGNIVAVGLAVILAWSLSPAHAGERKVQRRRKATVLPATECITRPPVSPNDLLDCGSDSSQPHHEPSMAVDPNDFDHIVVGANDLPGGVCCNSESYTSFDGGHSWTVDDVPFEPSKTFAADPSVAFDRRHGTVLFASNNYGVSQGNLCDGDLVVSVSPDGGLGWNGPYTVAAGQGCLFEVGSVGHEKPWITVDDNPASPHYGRAYVTSLEATCSEADCDPTLGHATFPTIEAQSDDGGYTWTAPRAPPAHEIPPASVRRGPSVLCRGRGVSPRGACVPPRRQ